MTLSSLYCCTSSLIGCVWFAQTPGRWRWRQQRRRTARLVRPLQPQDTVVSADADGSVTRTRPARCRCSGGGGNGTAGGSLWRLSRSVRRREENETEQALGSPTHSHMSCPPVIAQSLMTSVSIRNKSDYFVLYKQWVVCKQCVFSGNVQATAK